jgi:hypothetical protein
MVTSCREDLQSVDLVTAFLLLSFERPQVLLIDRTDKNDVDLPNDLLDLFKYPGCTVPELGRITGHALGVAVVTADASERVGLRPGRLPCKAFPLLVLIGNGERECPTALVCRCLWFDLSVPSSEQPYKYDAQAESVATSIDELKGFLATRAGGDLAADQLLNAFYLRSSAARKPGTDENQSPARAVLHPVVDIPRSMRHRPDACHFRSGPVRIHHGNHVVDLSLSCGREQHDAGAGNG